MIRNNKVSHQCSQSATIETVNLKNAVFQGEYDRNRGRPEGSGLIYLTEEHHFIAFGEMQDLKISGCTLFFHDNHRYHYGSWKNNQPNGLQIFRINDVLILADYNHGILLQGSKILLIFEKVNIGVIIEIGLLDNWKIVSKSQVYCSEHVQMLIRQSGFRPNQIFLTVVQYINNRLADSLNETRFKLIDNQYYRLGFNRGLAIIFDDDSNILSMGLHNKNSLISPAIKIDQNGVGLSQKKAHIGTIVLNKQHRPAHKVGKVYSRQELSELNFRNQVFSDPSIPYFEYYQNLLTSPIMKHIFSGFIVSSLIDLQSSSKKKSPQIKIEDKTNKGAVTFQNESFKEKSRIQAVQSKKLLVLSPKNSKQLESLDLNRKIFQQEEIFQNLSEKNRLNILKSELEKSLSNRNLEVVISKNYAYSAIERPKPVIKDTLTEDNRKLKTQSSKPIFPASKHSPKQSAEIEQFEQIIAKTPKSEQTAQKQVHNRSNERTKKKIFGQTKSSMKQYSPSPEKQIKSSKSRTKSKIFAPPIQKRKQQSEKAHKKEDKKIEIKSVHDDPSIKENSQCLSPYNKLKFSIERSQIESKNSVVVQQIKQSTHLKSKQKEKQQEIPIESDGIEQEDVKQIKNIRKLQIQGGNGRYKRDNQIYKNSMSKGPYSNYINEPIVIKQQKNAVYMKQITPQRSTHSPNSKLVYLAPSNCHKKEIIDTSPYKRNKMSSYMDQGDLIAANDSSKMRIVKEEGRRFNYF